MSLGKGCQIKRKICAPRFGRSVPRNESCVGIRSDAHAAHVVTGEENATAEDAEIAEVFVAPRPPLFRGKSQVSSLVARYALFVRTNRRRGPSPDRGRHRRTPAGWAAPAWSASRRRAGRGSPRPPHARISRTGKT